MSASDHDRAVAITSHVPQILSSLLVTLAERAPVDARGPAFEYATRSAGANPAVWRDIFATNGDEMSVFLRELAAELSGLADSLSRDPPDTARALAVVEAARKRRSQS